MNATATEVGARMALACLTMASSEKQGWRVVYGRERAERAVWRPVRGCRYAVGAGRQDQKDLDDELIDELVEQIKQDGLTVPIEVLNDQIIDGRHRWIACERLGIEPDMLDVETDDPIQYVLSLNLHRRHLSASQRAMIAAGAREMYDEQAKERSAANLKRGAKKPDPGKLPDREKGDSRDKAGKALNVSGKMVDAATTVREKGTPALVKAVESGEVSVTPAARVAGLPAEAQDAAVAKGKKGVPSSQ